MDEAGGNPNIEWQSAEAALENWFETDEKFENLPADLQTLFQRGRLPVPDLIVQLWNSCSANRKRQIARQRDLDTHPGLADVIELVWQKREAVDRWRRVASNKSEADRDARDVKVQNDEIARALAELKTAETMSQRIAEKLGLAPSSEKPRPIPTGKAVSWWVEIYLPLHKHSNKRPSREEQRAAVEAQFQEYAPPSKEMMQQLRANKATPEEWSQAGRLPKSN